MFFPYSTDAPVYYWPYATVAMIAVNVAVFCLELLQPGTAELLALQTGTGLHPYQWLTNNFVHADLMHILSNMLFLWSFGLVVEGKLGWRRTLAVYLGIGVAYGAAIQLLMLFHSPEYVLGASAIVFGFMAMSVVWAPENSLQFVYMISIRVGFCEFTIKAVVVFFLALQVVVLAFNRMALSSELLHVTGAAAGFGIAVWMLKTKRVDCENWDMFSIMANRHRMTEKERVAEAVNDPEYLKRQRERAEKRSADALDWIRDQLQQRNFKAALGVYRRVAEEQPSWKLPQAELCQLIAGLLQLRLTAEAIPLMGKYLSGYVDDTAVRLKLGEALIVEKRPAQAAKVLAKLPEAALRPLQRQLLLQLREAARRLHEQDPYEIADEDW